MASVLNPYIAYFYAATTGTLGPPFGEAGAEAALTLRKHLVHSFRRSLDSPMDIRWVWRLGRRIRWVRFLAWDTLCPTSLFLPHRSHAFAIELVVYHILTILRRSSPVDFTFPQCCQVTLFTARLNTRWNMCFLTISTAICSSATQQSDCHRLNVSLGNTMSVRKIRNFTNLKNTTLRMNSNSM